MLSSKQARSQTLYTNKAKVLNKVYTLEVDSLLVLSHPSFGTDHLVGFDKLDRKMLFKMALEYERMKQEVANLQEANIFLLSEKGKMLDDIHDLERYIEVLELKSSAHEDKEKDLGELLDLKDDNIDVLEKRLANCKMTGTFRTLRDILIGAGIGVVGYSIYSGATGL